MPLRISSVHRFDGTVIPPNSRFLGLRKGPRVWKPRIWVHIYVVKVKKGAEPFSKVHFLGDFEVRCSQMDVLPTVNPYVSATIFFYFSLFGATIF